MVKILHIVHALSRGGGLSNFIMNYYRNINREKIQFDFIYFKEVESDFKDEILSLGGKFYKFTQPGLNPAYKKEAKTFFENHNGEYNAIHCHVLFAAAVYSSIAQKYGVRHIISHSHSTQYGVGIIRRLRNRYFIKKAARNADIRMACSIAAAEFMYGSEYVRAGKVNVINNAIDCKKYVFDDEVRCEMRSRLGVENRFVLGHVGGFVPIKNHDFLIDVFHEVCKLNPDACLLLAGGEGTAQSSTLSQIKAKVDDLALSDKVKFLGIRSDIEKIMMAMDVFVFPSLFEGFGLVAVEAQSSGLPCIVSDAVPEDTRCTDKIKYLPLSDDSKVWAREIVDLPISDRYVNPDELSKYNTDVQVKRLEEIYLSMD